jgi:hypothetical protein
MKIDWRDTAYHYLQVVAFCCAVAVLVTAIWPQQTYLSHLGYALIIGTVTWSVIEFGRFVINEPGYHGWPHGWRGVLLTVVGIACGFTIGTRVGDWLFSHGKSTTYDHTISWVITGLAGIVASYYFHMRGRQAELAAKINAAERDAAEARLKLIATQIEPHMLFNTLANLRVLITADPPRAVAMLDRLNSYLRVTLGGSRALAHPLAAEFDRLADYLELMSVRMGERLHYTLELPNDLREVPVPPLMLQPLVENSIRHGLEPQVKGGEVTVRARRDGAQIVIEVTDTGVGIDTAAPVATEAGGFGLAQVRERLNTAYGTQGTMTMAPLATGGTRAAIRFPLPA